MIKDLGNEMRQFLNDMKENIKNPEDLDYMLKRTEKFFNVVFKEIEEIGNFREKEMKDIIQRQKEHEDKLDEMEEKMKELCIDIYDEDYGEFEITCPYCNYEFEADVDDKIDEIMCPECNNIIELDWDEENDEK